MPNQNELYLPRAIQTDDFLLMRHPTKKGRYYGQMRCPACGSHVAGDTHDPDDPNDDDTWQVTFDKDYWVKRLDPSVNLGPHPARYNHADGTRATCPGWHGFYRDGQWVLA